MKKLIIGLASLLFLARVLLGQSHNGHVIVEYTNVEPTFTEVGLICNSPFQDIFHASAIILKSHIELKEQSRSSTSNGRYIHKFKMVLKASPQEIRKFLGVPLIFDVSIMVHQEKIGPVPNEYVLNSITVVELVDFQVPTDPIAPSPPTPSLPPVVSPPLNNEIPTAPSEAPSRNIALFTQAQVTTQIAEAVAAALKDTFTLAELEAAERRSAGLAFEEGVAAVKARPAFYGIATTSLLGTQPFIRGWSFVEGLGWIHISPDLFPFVYAEKLKSWVLVHDEAGVLAYFIYKSQQWASYEELLDLN
jgi:hypothetical protein